MEMEWIGIEYKTHLTDYILDNYIHIKSKSYL